MRKTFFLSILVLVRYRYLENLQCSGVKYIRFSAVEITSAVQCVHDANETLSLTSAVQGLGTGMKLLAAAAAGAYGLQQSMYTVDGGHRNDNNTVSLHPWNYTVLRRRAIFPRLRLHIFFFRLRLQIFFPAPALNFNK